MHSDILACERSTYPVLLQCLKYPTRDVRPLQLVNKSMCAAFRHFKDQVDEHTAKRERHEAKLAGIEIAMSALDRLVMYNPACEFVRFVIPVERPPTHMQQRMVSSGPLVLAVRVRVIEPAPVHVMDTNMQIPPLHANELSEMWAELERIVNEPAIDLEPRNEGRTVSYSNNISDNSFDSHFFHGSRTFDPAQLATAAALDTTVVEVD